MFRKTNNNSNNLHLTRLSIFFSAFGIGSNGENLKKGFESSMKLANQKISDSQAALDAGQKAMTEANNTLTKLGKG